MDVVKRWWTWLTTDPRELKFQAQLAELKVQHHERLQFQGMLFHEQIDGLKLQLLQLRQDLMERIRDKDAVIADLKLRNAALESEAMKVALAKTTPVNKPVPDFGGPVPFQDELGRMSLEVEEEPETANEENS